MARIRSRLPTLLETVFAAAALAMAWHAVVPTIRRARDAARVDIAARALHSCDRGVHQLLRSGAATNRADVTLAQIGELFGDEGPHAIVWPTAADLSTFDPSGTNGCTVRVTLTDGSSVLVTAESNRVDHAN